MSIAPDPRRAHSRVADASGLVLRALTRLATAVLVVFHLWLLWTHIVTGRLLEPDVLLRWAVAAFVAAALLALYRLHLSLFWGRRAVVLWLLVVLIHGHAAWSGQTQLALADALPEAVAALMPVGAVAATVLLVVAAARAGERRVASLPRLAPVAARFATGPRPGSAPPPFSPRPPPAC